VPKWHKVSRIAAASTSSNFILSLRFSRSQVPRPRFVCGLCASVCVQLYLCVCTICTNLVEKQTKSFVQFSPFRFEGSENGRGREFGYCTEENTFLISLKCLNFLSLNKDMYYYQKYQRFYILRSLQEGMYNFSKS